MTSSLARTSPGRAARPNKTPHLHVLLTTMSSSSMKDSARGAHRLSALYTYTRAKKTTCTPLKRAPLLFQNRTVRILAASKLGVAMASLRCHKSGLARHGAALHRVALELHVTLGGVSRLRR